MKPLFARISAALPPLLFAVALASATAMAAEEMPEGKAKMQERELRATLAAQEKEPDGAKNAAVLQTCHSLALCLKAQGRPQEALPYAQRALAGRLALLGENASDADASRRLVNRLTYSTALVSENAKPEADPPLAMVEGALIRESDLTIEMRRLYPAEAPPEPVVPKRVLADVAARYEKEREIGVEVLNLNQPQKLASSGGPDLPALSPPPPGDLAHVARPSAAAEAGRRRNALDSLIDQQILLHEFHRLGGIVKTAYLDRDVGQIIQQHYGGSREALLASLKKAGMTESAFRAERERQIMMGVMRTRIGGEVKITEQQARDYNDAHKDRWPVVAEVRMHTLSIPKGTGPAASTSSRRHAEELRAQLQSGADFAKSARANSQDSHAEAGGAWDWVMTDGLTKPVRDAVNKTQKGQLSEVIDQDGTFIILRVDDYRAPPTPPFDQVKEDIARQLQKEKSSERVEARLAELRGSADIRLLAPAGK
jgi:hypothetical protein